MEIYRTFTFDAAHRLEGLAEGHQCGNTHGHTYTVKVTVSGDVDPETGWLMDFAELKRACEPLIGQLDHTMLNKVPGMGNPTSENISIWLWERLLPVLPMLSEVEVRETPGTGCRYRG